MYMCKMYLCGRAGRRAAGGRSVCGFADRWGAVPASLGGLPGYLRITPKRHHRGIGRAI